MQKQTWIFDESIHQGVNYADNTIVQDYDAGHTQFRDFEREAIDIIDQLELHSGHRVIDFGVGTGAFTIHAAPVCQHIDAIDVSEEMLTIAKQKAQMYHLSNVTFHQGGFLTYTHQALPVDCIVTVHALHHLPDFWKMVALQRMNRMLKPGGKLFLRDTVFPVKASEDSEILDEWVDNIRHASDESMADEAVIHIREEFSTYNWILEGMLEKAGFVIEKQDYSNYLLATYICVKKGGSGG